MSTITRTRTSEFEAISAIAHEASMWIADQMLLSQGRCVDVLLDLHSATERVGLRQSIEERLSEICHVNVVLADEMLADLAAIVALSEEGEDIDLTWAEELLHAQDT